MEPKTPQPLAPPARLVTGSDTNPESLVGAMKVTLEAESKQRESVYPLAKAIRHKASVILISFFSAADMTQLETSMSELAAQAQTLVAQTASTPRLLSLGIVTEALSEASALENLIQFINNGHLATPRSSQKIGGLPGASDTVYLSGIIKTCRSLERYAVGRATHGDRASVSVCAEFVEALLSKLMEFDFRNGPLRKAYDGVKYAHKRLGDVLYETSLCKSVSASDVAVDVNASKMDVALLLSLDDLEKVRLKMVASDEKREQVIKRCRDVQKLSKQAIFSIHRNEKEKARNQLSTAMAKAHAISSEFDFINEPELRSGSFQNAMEEWVEGRLFEAWLESDGRHILTPGELQAELTPPLKMTSEEYLGGLVDFTGEVGRWAVLKATQRDKEAVEKALVADLTVEAAMIHLGTSMPGKMNKKNYALHGNVKKLEHVLYELSLLKGTGKKTFSSEAKPGAVESDGGAKL